MDKSIATNHASCGCNIIAILASMSEEQNEHNCADFGETYIKYRKVVAEWMIDVCEYFNLHNTTTHAAIAYLDRLQPNEKFNRQQWQMLAICCILISSKYNECEEHVPDLATLEEITQQSISNETVLNFELWALKRMGWKLNARTPMAFLASYVVAGVTFPTDRCDSSIVCGESEDLSTMVSRAIYTKANVLMLDTKYKKFKASSVACAVIYDVRASLMISPVWRPELKELTHVIDPTDNSHEVGQVLKLMHAADCESKSCATSASPSSVQNDDSVNTFFDDRMMANDNDNLANNNNNENTNPALLSPASPTPCKGTANACGSMTSPSGKENVLPCGTTASSASASASVTANYLAPVTPDAKTVLGDASKLEFHTSPMSVADDINYTSAFKITSGASASHTHTHTQTHFQSSHPTSDSASHPTTR